MKAQLGRPTGLALALLAALLATLLAMGAFSVALAQTETDPSATRSFSGSAVSMTDGSYTVTAGDDVEVTIAIEGDHDQATIVEAWPEGFNLDASSLPNFPSLGATYVTGDDGRSFIVRKASGELPDFSYTVTAPQQAGGPHSFQGVFRGKVGTTAFSGDIADATMITVVAAATDGNGNGNGTGDANGESGPAIELSSQEPGAAVEITIAASASASQDEGDILPDQQIVVDLSAFSVPDTIADSDIGISSEDYRGNPSNVVVSGKKVTMTVPNVKANGDDQDKSVMGNYTIRIKQSAGVKNAASGGKKTVKWVENAPNAYEAANKEASEDIHRVIKLSATAGTRGTETTATLKGFANDTTTVFLNGTTVADKLAEVTVADNTGTLEIDTTSSKFLQGEGNTIYARDADGNWQDVPAKFEITPTVSLDPEETAVSKTVKVSLSDWPAGPITKVELGGEDYVFFDADGEVDDYPIVVADGTISFNLNVASNANRGTQTVKVTQGEVSATASLTIGVLSLSAQPATVVPGQQITIQGGGFLANDRINSVSVGGIPVEIAPAVEASSAGDIVITINVPSPEGNAIGSGDKTISVTADGNVTSSGRVAEGSIEIPAAAITLDPTTSRRGTTVNVTGSGFPSGDLVQVKYENNANFVTVAAGSADASGAISIDFVVPSYARIGTEHKIEAISVGVYAPVTAKASHDTPGAVVTLSSLVISSGETITISGMNFPAFATVAEMEIGGVDVRPVPAPATSIEGDFTSIVLVPQLELGNQTVSIRVSQTTITTFLQIGTAAVSRAPADLFADLIEADALDRIFRYENDTQEWFLYDPDPGFEAANSLESLETGNIIWIQLKEAAEVQGANLLAGWSLITVQ